VASSLAGCVSLVANCANEYRVTTSRVCSFCVSVHQFLHLLCYQPCIPCLLVPSCPVDVASEAVLMALDPNRSLDSATAQTWLIAC
jgi:hypothetical protein